MMQEYVPNFLDQAFSLDETLDSRDQKKKAFKQHKRERELAEEISTYREPKQAQDDPIAEYAKVRHLLHFKKVLRNHM